MTAKCGISLFSVGIDGVSVTVKCKTSGVAVVAEPDADGYIFGLEGVEEATIIIEIEPDTNVFGFNIDGNKNITQAKNYSEVGRVYRKKVPIHIPIHKGKKPYTQYNENHIKLLEIDTGGYFAIWEAAIVFQREMGFLTTQKVYEGRVFRNGLFLSCPKFDEKWPKIIDFIGLVSQQTSIRFPSLRCFRFPSLNSNTTNEIKPERLDDNVGVVKWYNVAQGFGAISTNKDDAFVHYKDIDSPKRLVCLDIEDIVLFEKLIPNTSGKGSFPYKAVGVLAP